MQLKTRSVYIEEGLSLSDTGSQTIDIKPGSPISALELIFGGTKGATENQSDKLQDVVDTIELVDGSEVIWSLSMKQAVALNCFEMGRKPAHEYDLAASGTPQETVWLNFGRILFDPNYYLDPRGYNNLQLRVKTSLTAAAGTYVTATLTLDVVAHLIDEGAGGFEGYLSAKEVYSWTTVASGIETVDLPKEYPVRFLLVGAPEDGIAPVTDITDVKLTAEADRFIIFDYDTADWLLRNRSQFGLFTEYIKSAMQDTDTLNSSLFDIIGVQSLGGDEDFGCRCASLAGNTMTFSFYAQT